MNYYVLELIFNSYLKIILINDFPGNVLSLGNVQLKPILCRHSAAKAHFIPNAVSIINVLEPFYGFIGIPLLIIWRDRKYLFKILMVSLELFFLLLGKKLCFRQLPDGYKYPSGLLCHIGYI